MATNGLTINVELSPVDQFAALARMPECANTLAPIAELLNAYAAMDDARDAVERARSAYLKRPLAATSESTEALGATVDTAIAAQHEASLRLAEAKRAAGVTRDFLHKAKAK